MRDDAETLSGKAAGGAGEFLECLNASERFWYSREGARKRLVVLRYTKQRGVGKISSSVRLGLFRVRERFFEK